MRKNISRKSRIENDKTEFIFLYSDYAFSGRNKMKIKLEPYIEEFIDDVLKYTTLSREDVINWCVKEAYSNFFLSNDFQDLLDYYLAEWKK
jgi:hypothetical protein